MCLKAGTPSKPRHQTRTLSRSNLVGCSWGKSAHTQTHTHTKKKVLFRHMCPGVIYERALGRKPQRGPLHAAWLWVLCAIPQVSTGLPHTPTQHTNKVAQNPPYEQ